jgi:phenylacetate-CoA ligase
MPSLDKFLFRAILQIGDFLNRSNFVKNLDKWQRYDLLTEKELDALQHSKLDSILRYASTALSPYQQIEYTDDPFKLLGKFPVADKAFIANNLEYLVDKKKKDLIKYSSSGSSGIQSTTYMSKEEQSDYRAIQIHWWKWAGYMIGDPLIQTGITPKRGSLKGLKDILFRTIYVNAFSHTEKQLEDLFIKVSSKPNKYYSLVGYASSLNVICEYFKTKQADVELKTCISLGDKLFDQYRKNVNNTFNCPVHDTYGCNEGVMIASEFDLPYKYIMSPHVYLEILDENNLPVADGNIGNVVITKLDSFSMPLIRYKNGDLAIKLPKSKYPQNRKLNYPLLQEVVGRITDVVKTPSGNKLVVHAFTGFFEYIEEIKQFQIIQSKLDFIEVCVIVRDDLMTKQKFQVVKSNFKQLISDPELNIVWNVVEKIPSSPSGKPKLVYSKL